MGLFPEIGRAWLTIDSDIYIWTYENSRDVAYYDGLNQLIVSVELVKPKPNVFINDVKYLLILTTAIEIVVLGVTFGDGSTKIITSSDKSFSSANYQEMQLMNKPIFVINTDNITMLTVKGSEDGRIFLGGRDGCLYEILYQAESNWFGKRYKKVNHSQSMISVVVPGFLKIFSENDSIAKIDIDSQRQILYTLSEKGAIEAWDITNGSARSIFRQSQNDIANTAASIMKTVDASIFKPVTDICILDPNENNTFFLVAITESGVRLYFGDFNMFYQPQNDNRRMPSLSLQHIRLPPGYTLNSIHGKPRSVHSTFHSSGTFLMISSAQPSEDILWSLSSSPFLYTQLSSTANAMQSLLAESSSICTLDGHVWAIAEIKNKSQSIISESQNDKRVIILTTQGAHFVELLKPTNILQQVLNACNGAHHDAVKSFFDIHLEPECATMSLQLACSEEKRVGFWAVQAFFRYGGEPHFISPQQIMQQQSVTDFSRTFNQGNSFQAGFQRPNQPQNPFGNNNSFMQPNETDFHNLRYSAKHGALYLYITRLLRPIWNRKCIDANISSTITVKDCSALLNKLSAVRFFIESNHSNGTLRHTTTKFNDYQQSIMNNNFSSQNQSRMEEAHIEETKSIDALFSFLKFSCEFFELWKILCEHQLHLLVEQLSLEHREVLFACTFRDIILYRSDLSGMLIVSIINSYLKDNASVKIISEKLRDVCPNLYSNEDAILHRVTEILRLSRNIISIDEKQENYFKALDLCCQAIPKLPLTAVCQQFMMAGFYDGVIKLCLLFAKKIDPNESAKHFYKNNYRLDPKEIPMNDRESYNVFIARMKCYEEVQNVLKFVYNNASTNEQAPVSISSNQELQSIINFALNTEDQLLHVAVYEWMLANHLYDEILMIKNSTLGEHLGQFIDRNNNQVEFTDLLWKYYEKNGMHHKAAKILHKIAITPNENVHLSKRIEYLARAVMCMRSDSVGYISQHGEMLRELEDLLDVTQVQKHILDCLSQLGARTHDSVQNAIKLLDSRIYSISSLYSEFAEKFNLWESQLKIFHCSHHTEFRLISSVWNNILDQQLDEPGSPKEKAHRMISKFQSLVNDYGVGPSLPISKNYLNLT
jgi:nuclear pore complex protein Nup155